MSQSRSETPTEEEQPAVLPLSALEKEWGKPPVITGEELEIITKEEEEEEPKPKPKPRKKIKRKRPKKKVRKVRKKSRKS